MKFSLKKRQKKTDDTVTDDKAVAPPSLPPDAETQEKAKIKKAKREKITAPKKPSYPRKSRFTLLIGDEGAILLHMKGSTVLSRQFVADASPSNLDELRETIENDHQAPITMIIDSIDQSFVQQTLPPVSSLSVQKLIKRRLDRDFKPADIKGAIVLGKDKEGRKDWNFLMISVEKSPQLVLWLDFIMTFDNRFRGIVLLSVEAGIFVKNLERALGISSKIGTGSEWKILVSHNKVGGFRQIILRNGRMIFTRLALPVGEPTPPVVAGHIEQEMVSTIEYLKRFGYHPKAGLDVYILASEEVCKLVDVKRLEARNYHPFSPNEVAQKLGIKGATQPTDQFGDVVLAAAIGSIRKNILKLTTIESRLFDKYQLFKIGQRFAATFIILGLVVYGAISGYGALITQSELEDSEQKLRVGNQALEAVKRQIKDSKIDVELVGDQADLFKQIKSEARSPLPFIAQLAPVIKSPIKLKLLKWEFGDGFPVAKMVPSFVNFNVQSSGAQSPGAPAMPPGAAMPPNMPPGLMTAPTAAPGTAPNAPAVDGLVRDMVSGTLTLEFPAGLKSPALFKKFSEDFLKEMNQAMPDYSLAYTNIPQEYLDTKSLQMSFDQQPSESNLGLQPVLVEISFRGNMPTGITKGGAP